MARQSRVSKEEDMIDRIDKIKTFVLDMDGTIYLGNELFPFTKKFLKDVEDQHKKYYFLQTTHLKISRPILINWKKWRLRSNRNR